MLVMSIGIISSKAFTSMSIKTLHTNGMATGQGEGGVFRGVIAFPGRAGMLGPVRGNAKSFDCCKDFVICVPIKLARVLADS